MTQNGKFDDDQIQDQAEQAGLTGGVPAFLLRKHYRGRVIRNILERNRSGNTKPVTSDQTQRIAASTKPGTQPQYIELKDEKETIIMLKKLTKIPQVKIRGHTFLPLPGTPWQNEKPGKISSLLKEFLNELNSTGKIYGDWKEQESLAKKIASLFA